MSDPTHPVVGSSDTSAARPAPVPIPVSVIIPAYLEEGAVAGVIDELRTGFADATHRGPDEFEIIVIDDGSTDATGDRARGAGATVIRHPENRGYGASLKTGLKAARHPVIVMTDADGTYPASAIAALLAEVTEGRADLAVGARRGADVNIPPLRKPVKWLLTRFAVFLAGREIPDLNSGLRVFRRDDAMRFARLYPRGFSFSTTMSLAYLCSDDLHVTYVDIGYRKRTGHSKFHPIRDTKNLFLTIVRCVLFFNPLRVALPLAGVLFALGLWVLAVPRDVHGNVMDGTVEVLVICGLQVLMMGFLADVLARMR